MKIIEVENYLYTLYKLDDKYFFSVICGTVALYEVTLEFSKEEILNYTQNKKKYLYDYSEKIQNNINFYKSRFITDFDIKYENEIVTSLENFRAQNL